MSINKSDAVTTTSAGEKGRTKLLQNKKIKVSSKHSQLMQFCPEKPQIHPNSLRRWNLPAISAAWGNPRCRDPAFGDPVLKRG